MSGAEDSAGIKLRRLDFRLRPKRPICEGAYCDLYGWRMPRCLIAASARRSPLAFHFTAFRFAGQAPLLRAKGWARRLAKGTLDCGLPDHADKPVDGVPAIGLLCAETRSCEYDFAVLRQPRSGNSL